MDGLTLLKAVKRSVTAGFAMKNGYVMMEGGVMLEEMHVETTVMVWGYSLFPFQYLHTTIYIVPD